MQALEMLALMCGYDSYLAAKQADLSQGHPVAFDEVVARLQAILPAEGFLQIHKIAVGLGLHSGPASPEPKDASRFAKSATPVVVRLPAVPAMPVIVQVRKKTARALEMTFEERSATHDNLLFAYSPEEDKKAVALGYIPLGVGLDIRGGEVRVYRMPEGSA